MKTRGVLHLSCLVLLAGVAHADSLYVRLVGQYDLSGTPFSVAAAADYAYVGDGETLRVVSVVDPAQPVQVGACGSLRSARGITVGEGYVYVAVDAVASLRVVSVADPSDPTETGICSLPGAIDVAVDGDYVYVAAGDSGLRVISVADPTHPVEVGHCHAAGFAYNVHVSNGLAFVAGGSAGLRIISVADPSNPTEVGYFSTDGDVNAVAADGEYAYVASAGADSTFRVLSIADPSHPVEVGQCYYFDNWPSAAPQDMKVARGYAFLASMRSGLRVMSIADPAHPYEAGHYTLGSCWAVALDRDYVYFAAYHSMVILHFYQLGDLDIDNDSLDVAADTLRLLDWMMAPGDSIECVRGEFILANTSASYNPDSADGPSVSQVDSLRCTGSLTGPGGTIDSIVTPNLSSSFAQGQTMVCTLAAYVPVGLKDGDYTGSVYVSGKDTAGLWVYESCYVRLTKLGDLDVDSDSLDVVADTIRARPRLVSAGPPPVFSEYALGEFLLTNSGESYNPDSADGPSHSTVRSLRFTAALAGPRGTIDSIGIRHFPESLALGQAAVCTLAAYVPPELPDGDYSGQIVIARSDTLEFPLAETVYALVIKLGDLDIDGDSLDVVHDTMNVRVQPVYLPSGKARFMLASSGSYNPDAEDGPSRSALFITGYSAYLYSSSDTIDSVHLHNMPARLEPGQAVECTLALALPPGTRPDGYVGRVTIDACDTLGYRVRDSFTVRVNGPVPRQNLDSLRVAPIPFKPHQNPEHDAIHFQGLTAGARVIVYDASGQSVWSDTEKGDGHIAWDARVASGIYVYLVVAEDGKSRVGKLSVIR